jgi:hypothetical protein
MNSQEYRKKEQRTVISTCILYFNNNNNNNNNNKTLPPIQHLTPQQLMMNGSKTSLWIPRVWRSANQQYKLAGVPKSMYWLGYVTDVRGSGVRCPIGTRDLSLFQRVRSSSGSTQSPVQWVPGAQIFDLLRCYASLIGIYLPTFRDNLSDPSSTVKQTKNIFLDCLTLEDGMLRNVQW